MKHWKGPQPQTPALHHIPPARITRWIKSFCSQRLKTWVSGMSQLSEQDSCDIHEAAVTPLGAERSGERASLPGFLGSREMFKYKDNVFGGARPPKLGEWRTREKIPRAPIGPQKKLVRAGRHLQEDAAQCAHFTDGESEAKKGPQLKVTAERRAWPQGSYATWVGVWVTFTKSARKG